MKPHFKTLAIAILAACLPVLAAVPLRWTVETSRAQPQRIDVYRGETVTIAADLTSYGQPLALAGDVALYLQTNGMGTAWWTVPATVHTNRIEATLAPSAYPADASQLNCYLGGPAVNYRAAFQARILGAPGPAPNTVQPPVVTLDYSTFEVLNAPYWTKDEADSRFGGSSITASVVTNIAAAVTARDALPKAGGAALNLTVSGEFRLDDGSGNYGVIGYAGNEEANSTLWSVGVPGFWLGDYRLRNPGSGETATIAFLADLPDLAPYAAAAQVATNASTSISSHVSSTANPHNVTAAQVGAIAKTGATRVGSGFALQEANGAELIWLEDDGWKTSIRPLNVDIAQRSYKLEDFNLLGYASYLYDYENAWRTVAIYDENSELVDCCATTNDLAKALAAIPMTYAATNALVQVNCSVQTVVDPANNTLPTFQVPAAVPGGVRDWIVHVVSSGQTDITMTGFPATVDGNKAANFFSPMSAEDIAKAIAHGTITTFTFSEINSTQNAVNFLVMRAELTRVSPSN